MGRRRILMLKLSGRKLNCNDGHGYFVFARPVLIECCVVYEHIQRYLFCPYTPFALFDMLRCRQRKIDLVAERMHIRARCVTYCTVNTRSFVMSPCFFFFHEQARLLVDPPSAILIANAEPSTTIRVPYPRMIQDSPLGHVQLRLILSVRVGVTGIAG